MPLLGLKGLLILRDQASGHAFTQTFVIGPRCEKTYLRGFANNTGADQPAHPRSLISAFVIRLLERIICKLAAGEFQFSS